MRKFTLAKKKKLDDSLKSFVDYAIDHQDENLDELLDEYISLWHILPHKLPALHIYLGLTWDEYVLFVEGQSSIQEIIRKRKNHNQIL